ncbi:nuclear receptor family 2 group C protein [Wolffia australiana]
MAKRKKSVATRLDEVDRTMYSTFCSAANSLSLLYTQAMNQQKVTFQAGERHAAEKVYNWILGQQEAGTRLTVADIVGHLQAELDHGGEDPSMSPRLAPAAGSNSQAGGGGGQHGPRLGQVDQAKNSAVFSNALSSPVRRSLQPYHLAQPGGFCPTHVPGPRTHETTREADTSMDMHSDPEP